MANHHLLLAVTGSVAAYKAIELLRIMRKKDVECTITMTHAAQKFVTPYTFEILSKKAVWLDLFQHDDYRVPHVEIANDISAIVIAPATAQVIHDIAQGKADSPLLATILSSTCPVIIVPAMETKMWENVLVQQNVQTLKQYQRFCFIGPDSGDLASGKQGFGRMVEPKEISEEIFTYLSLFQKTERVGDLSQETIIITAGPTRESLDPMRYISNRSSGKMGYAIARAAVSRQAKVFLISGPTSDMAMPSNVEIIMAETAQEMLNVSKEIFRNNNVSAFIGTAAVCDFRAKDIALQKISKRVLHEKLQLSLNPDVIHTLCKEHKQHTTFIGFAAETSDILLHAKEKLFSKELDCICANSIDGQSADNNLSKDQKKISIIYKDGTIEQHGPSEKEHIAHAILDAYLLIKNKKPHAK